jgi:hypothetical protein
MNKPCAHSIEVDLLAALTKKLGHDSPAQRQPRTGSATVLRIPTKALSANRASPETLQP